VFGRLFVENPVYIDFDKSITLESAKISFLQYIFGSIPLAIIAGVTAALFTYLFLLIRRNRKKRKEK
jgi:ABC-type Fe3+ transport system permease subunit